ncbi:MAG TPA: 6,7-dimethyl-8-ribityllumazine synthase [Acidimicrobiales bacterium]|nr:6,7-dimethyl-8-ribityllumazine synthase [Acidimicrobiales bacterium]
MTTYEGELQGDGTRIAVVCSRFNREITERLLAGALDGLRAHGVDDGSTTIAWVPGAFELPLAAARLAGSGEYDAVVCLGAVIRGATGHYEQVAGQCAAGIQRAQMDTGVPVIFGVLTTDTLDHALERAGVATGESPAGEYLRQEHAGPAGGMSSKQAGSATGDLSTEQPVIPAGRGPTGTTAMTAGTGADQNVRPKNAIGCPPISNKGYEAAMAALEMCDLLRQLPKSPRA